MTVAQAPRDGRLMDSRFPAAAATCTEQLSREIRLPIGTLKLSWTEQNWEFDDLCDFGTRQYASRGFLIISRPLGRHLPCSPTQMRRAIVDLAALIPAELPGPALFVGLAETAITLGQGVYETCQTRHGLAASMFIHSTRQLTGNPIMAQFSEPHSHASAHLIHRPLDAALRETLPKVRSLVLVDDEVTSGSTLVNLAAALSQHLPALEQIFVATLTDWSGNRRFLEQMPVTARAAALLYGGHEWIPAATTAACPPKTAGHNSLGRLRERVNLGRHGIRGRTIDIAKLRARIGQLGSEPLHVIGIGELHFPAFLLAEALVDEGYDVVVQASTRSPIRVGQAISAAFELPDPHGTKIPSFLYNLDQTSRRRRIVCSESDSDGLVAGLIRPGDVGLFEIGVTP